MMQLQKDIATIKEPVYNSNNPKWLIVKQVPVINDNRPAKDIIKNPKEPEYEIVFDIQDPNIWRCKKCEGTFYDSGIPDECLLCNRMSKFERVTENIDEELWKLPRWEDIPIEDLDMLGLFDDMVRLFRRIIIFPEDIYYKLYVLWIISTWKSELWETVCFLVFRGLVESGKSRGLDICRELCYRMFHCSGVSFPAMVRVTDRWGAGVLIDEIDNKVDIRTESGRAYVDFLKPSYRRGAKYVTAHLENQDDVKKYKNFGFKAFAGEKGGMGEALFSRSIDIQMEQAYPEVNELKEVQDEFDRIQTILLNYKYKTNEPPELPVDCFLKGRDREIFSCIIRTAMHIGIDTTDIYDFIKSRRQEIIDDLQESDEYLILRAIKNLENASTLDDAPEALDYGDIARDVGWDPDTEFGKKKRQKLGYIFKKKLQLKTKRRKQGCVLLLNHPTNERKLKNLYRRYGL